MFEQHPHSTCTAFQGSRCIATGGLEEVVGQAKEAIEQDSRTPILIFRDINSQLVEFDFRGSKSDVLGRVAQYEQGMGTVGTVGTEAAVSTAIQDPKRGPGRPKLGVVSREVTLLPRHWDWLNRQPGGASVTLRKLVEQARKTQRGPDRVRRSQEATYRFISAMAGDRPGFEEANRALYAGKREHFNECMAAWPIDIQRYAAKLSAAAFQPQGESGPHD